MRVASYNLFEGAENTFFDLQTFVGEQDIDVLCLQEANRWNMSKPSRLDEMVTRGGFSEAIFGDSNTEYKLATFSRGPLLSAEVFNQNFWHCAIRVAVDYHGTKLNIWNVHLDPRSEDHRVAEAKYLASLINKNEEHIITGDFNSLTRSDGYDDALAAELAEQDITKFGDGVLRFDVTDYLQDEGLLDVAAKLNIKETTVPTPANKDKYHAADMRLDYAFVSEGLIKTVSEVTIIKSPLTDKISDHYPLILTLDA